MDYTNLLIEKINYNDISKKTEIIIENLNLLDNNINKIKKKIASINKIYNPKRIIIGEKTIKPIIEKLIQLYKNGQVVLGIIVRPKDGDPKITNLM